MEWLRRLVALLLAGTHILMAQAPEGPTIPNLPDVNQELLKLVVEDQWDRGMDMFSGRQVRSPESLDWKEIDKRDAERRAAVRSIMKAGRIQSGREYQFAAILFQHSADATDVQAAHLLASTAVVKGNPRARWLAAASFDRLLWTLSRPQVFGTQFKQDSRTNTWTMDPYDREAISDTLRAAWCVVGLTEQEQVLKNLQTGGGNPTTSVADCR